MTVRYFIIIILLFSISAVFGEDSAVLEPRSLNYQHVCRVETFTEKAEMITCPVPWVPITYLAEDGAKVSEGEIITRFDQAQPLFELRDRELERDVIDAQLSHRLTGIANKDREMRDKLEELQDKLVVLKARLVRLQSEPRPSDVEIAEGRLRIARMNYDAAERDAERARQRLEKGMISHAELEDFETELLMKKANLDYAERELAYTKLPATAGTIRKTELEIENLNLEIEKVQHEIEEHKVIAEIQKKGAQSRKTLIDKQIEEQQEDVEKTDVKSPIDGYVNYNRGMDWTDLEVGTKMWKNFSFMKIPDMKTIAFRGVLLESVRKYFTEGDTAIVRLRGRGDQPVSCRLKSISTLSHDLAEKAESDWGAVGKEFGVKVFDVVLEMTDETDWVRPGMIGEAQLLSVKETSGPAVPMRFVQVKDGKKYLSIDGIYREVTGTVNQGLFVVDDPGWRGRTVTMRGVFQETDESEKEGRKRLFSVSGELAPVDSIDVIVGDVGRWPWPKVKWLIPEESVVKKGDVVARLDDTEIKKRITEEESRVSETRSRMEELEKQKGLTAREGIFKLKLEQNLLETARIDEDTACNGRDAMAIYKASLTMAQAQIQLDAIRSQLEREAAKETTSLSPAELRQLERDRERQELKLEQARIRLEQLHEGAGRVECSNARLARLRQEVKVKVMERTTDYDDKKIALEYERASLDVKKYQDRLNQWNTRRNNMTITSPGDGMICYSKIWNSGVISKVNVGSTVGPRFGLLSIPDLSKMTIRVEVPEMYYTMVQIDQPVDVSIPSLTDRLMQGHVEGVDFLFKNREKKDSQVGLYSSREPLGEVVFTVRVTVRSEGLPLKPGAVAEVFFPFERE